MLLVWAGNPCPHHTSKKMPILWRIIMIKVNTYEVEFDGQIPVLVAESICAVLTVFRKLEDYQQQAYISTLLEALASEVEND